MLVSNQHYIKVSRFSDHVCVFLQAQYNVTLTSQTNPDQVLNQILSVLPEKKVDFTQKGWDHTQFLLLSHKTTILFSPVCVNVCSAHCSGTPWSVRPVGTLERWPWRLSWRCACCRGQRLLGFVARGWREMLGFTNIWWRTSSLRPVSEFKRSLQYYFHLPTQRTLMLLFFVTQLSFVSLWMEKDTSVSEKLVQRKVCILLCLLWIFLSLGQHHIKNMIY